MYTKKVRKQGADINYYGSGWSGFVSGDQIELYNITTSSYSSGMFRDPIATTNDSSSRILTDDVDFIWNNSIDTFFDTSTGGVLAEDTAFRLVHDTKNIKDATGLNIQNIVAKDSTSESSWSSPPIDTCYIDPIEGKFLLHQPIFKTIWTNIDNHIIGKSYNSKIINYIDVEYINNVNKFTNTLSIRTTSLGAASQPYVAASMKPLGDSYLPILDSGVMSCWLKLANSESEHTLIKFFGHEIKIGTRNAIKNAYIKSNSGAFYSLNDDWYPETSWFHLFIVWDKNAGLTGSKTFRAFLNGVTTAIFEDDNDLITNNDLEIIFYDSSTDFYNSTVLGPMTIWGDVFTEDPTFEFNSGNGREDSISLMYGSSNNYKPKLFKAGQNFIEETDTPLIVPQTGTLINYIKEDQSLPKAEGLFSTIATKLRNTALGQLIEGADYIYEESMNDIVDISTDSGFDVNPFNPGEYIRLSHDGTNLYNKGITKFIAKDFSDLSEVDSPPSDEIWIQPKTGEYVLPRPIFWSRMNSVANFNTPEIKYLSYTPELDINTVSVVAGKFGNALGTSEVGVYNNIYPFKNHNVNNLTKFTLSVWGFGHRQPDFNSAIMRIYFNDEIYFEQSATTIAETQKVYVNGIESSRLGTWLANTDTNYATKFHIYIVVDKDAGLNSGKSIRVWVNGSEILYSTETFELGNINLSLRLDNIGTETGSLFFDNLKIWNDAIEDASYEYNSGTGNENLLHKLWFPQNYPLITSECYTYIVGGDLEIRAEQASQVKDNLYKTISSNGFKKDDFSTLIENSDFVYDEDMTSITDTTTLTDFDINNLPTDKYVRIIENGKNVTDGTGLGLTPIAKNLSDITELTSPDKNKIWIDPISGRFMFPMYFFHMSLNGTITPQKTFSNLSPTETTSGTPPSIGYSAGKLNSCRYASHNTYVSAVNSSWLTTNPTSSVSGNHILNLFSNQIYSMPEGSLSFWTRSDLSYGTAFYSVVPITVDPGMPWSARAYTSASIYITDSIRIIIIQDYNSAGGTASTLYLYEDGTLMTSASIGRNAWYHIGVTWNFNTDSIQLWLNNTSIFTGTFSTTQSSNCKFNMSSNVYSYSGAWGYYCYGTKPDSYCWREASSQAIYKIDNIKLWNFRLNNFSHEYNGGAGFEDGYADIYPSTNNYKPIEVRTGYYKTAAGGTYSDWRIK